MNLLKDNIIPGNHGKIFGTNAVKEKDLIKIKNALYNLSGIKDVIINMEIFPKEFTIYTSKLVKVEDIENEVKRIGFHIISKGLFEL